MSTKCLLIDQYQTETRVAIVKDNRLEDFDYEVLSNKLKKGNIYRARVMRVEPSLQAAFVDFGDEKHGFLAFSEIHPCYYHTDKNTDKKLQTSPLPPSPVEQESSKEVEPEQAVEKDQAEIEGEQKRERDHEAEDEENSAGEEDEIPPKPKVSDQYRIQDVIKKNQMMLVQLVKDSRGTKGAALTTYVSLPGRYSVLMPNTPNGSGISRKITSSTDRDAIKKIIGELELPEEMSIIVRTAGLDRKKSEIKKDCDYLIRLWNTISKKNTKGPALVYEEQDLLIRALRDLYATDMEKIWIQGDEAFKKARDFMKVFMPTHVKRVSLYEEAFPSLFEKFGIEEQIDGIYDHTVTLPSGGSIVINPTEALVAIDVNSAKSTQQKNIEDTALKTNLEAAEAIARQLRLRDLAGLIVIDFIDMAPQKNAQVEKMLKDALKLDRARLKIGKISGFGLLEMSRQRLRSSLIETHTSLCSACQGTGRTVSISEVAMKILRTLQNKQPFPTESQPHPVTLSMATELSLLFLNEHRREICDLEKRIGIALKINIDPTLRSSEFSIEGFDLPPETSPIAPIIEKKENKPSRRRARSKKEKAPDAPMPLPETETTPSTDSIEKNEVEQQELDQKNQQSVKSQLHQEEKQPVKQQEKQKVKKPIKKAIKDESNEIVKDQPKEESKQPPHSLKEQSMHGGNVILLPRKKRWWKKTSVH